MNKCANCGFPFEQNRRGRPRKYCRRRECYLERARARVSFHYWQNRDYRMVICPECGGEFVTHTKNKIYCSSLCKRRYNDRKRYYRDRPELFAYVMRRKHV